MLVSAIAARVASGAAKLIRRVSSMNCLRYLKIKRLKITFTAACHIFPREQVLPYFDLLFNQTYTAEKANG